MATLSITVTNGQGTRAAAAFGHWSDVTQTVWVPATQAQLETIIKQWAKSRVLEYERQLADEAKLAELSAEVW